MVGFDAPDCYPEGCDMAHPYAELKPASSACQQQANFCCHYVKEETPSEDTKKHIRIRATIRSVQR